MVHDAALEIAVGPKSKRPSPTRTWLVILSDRNHSIVRFRPSSKRTLGLHPSNDCARRIEGTRCIGPVGIERSGAMSPLLPQRNAIRRAASEIVKLSVVPTLTGVPSLTFSAAVIVASTTSSTKTHVLTCAPLPHTDKGSASRHDFAINAVTEWSSGEPGPYTVKYRHIAASSRPRCTSSCRRRSAANLATP